MRFLSPDFIFLVDSTQSLRLLKTIKLTFILSVKLIPFSIEFKCQNSYR